MKRLLKSIQIQTFRDFEVVVTDNSPDDAVEAVCQQFSQLLPLRYHRNTPPLGISPNWNAAVEKSGGEWVKIMHSDDWFAGKESLAQFAKAAQQYPRSFIFSAYYNCSEGTGRQEVVQVSALNQRLLRQSYFHLLRSNYVGPPSTGLVHRSIWQNYNPELKWIADFEGYIRMLQTTENHFYYLKVPLVCIGLHEEQTTSNCALNPEVEIPENTLLYNTFQPRIFQNFFAYDYFWRLIRNLNIKDTVEFESHLAGKAVPVALVKLIQRANGIPNNLRSVGALSKAFAFLFWMEQLLRKPATSASQSIYSQNRKQ